MWRKQGERQKITQLSLEGKTKTHDVEFIHHVPKQPFRSRFPVPYIQDQHFQPLMRHPKLCGNFCFAGWLGRYAIKHAHTLTDACISYDRGPHLTPRCLHHSKETSGAETFGDKRAHRKTSVWYGVIHISLEKTAQGVYDIPLPLHASCTHYRCAFFTCIRTLHHLQLPAGLKL